MKFLSRLAFVFTVFLAYCWGSESASAPAGQDRSSLPSSPSAPPPAAAATHPAPAPLTEPAAAPRGATTPAVAVSNPPAPPTREESAPEHSARKTSSDPEADEIDRLIKYTQVKADDGDFETALVAYRQLMARKLNPVQERSVLLGFARALRKKGDLTKAAAVYEKLLKDYPLEEDAPEIYLELGRTLRALGAYKSAISRFYNVINSTLKLPENGAVRYRQLAKTAQFEIAETHFQAANYQEASRFFSRLRLLDLAPSDRARAHFKSAYALFLADDHLNAVSSLRSFLEQNPDDENVPEAHYLLAISYRRLQRPMEALVEALELLRMEKTKTAKDPKRWAYWQRKTGNQIANEFYENGDSASALTIYETLAGLSAENAWKLPILYQIGLCNERLSQTDKAVANYQSILDNLRTEKGNEAARGDLSDLGRMANWRLSQISWQRDTQQRLQALVPQQRTAQAPSTPK